MTTDPLDVLDLDADRRSRAAAREGRGDGLPVRIGGQVIAVLPVELPVDVLAPLREIDEDLALMLRTAMNALNAVSAQDAKSAFAAGDLVVDLLVSNPGLPNTLLNTVRSVAAGLLGEDGLTALLAQRPTREDYAFLIKGVFKFYGVSLGEASESSDSPDDGGGTSPTTSSTSSDSTPAASTPTPAAPPTPASPETPDAQPRLAS